MGGDVEVSIEACEGNVSGTALYARVSVRPSDASVSRLGVRPGGPPNAPTRSLRSVSMVTNSTLQPRHAPDINGDARPERNHHAAPPTRTMKATAVLRPLRPSIARRRPVPARARPGP